MTKIDKLVDFNITFNHWCMLSDNRTIFADCWDQRSLVVCDENFQIIKKVDRINDRTIACLQYENKMC